MYHGMNILSSAGGCVPLAAPKESAVSAIIRPERRVPGLGTTLALPRHIRGSVTRINDCSESGSGPKMAGWTACQGPPKEEHSAKT